MPELRKDPVIGRWVIVATERARRPGNIVESIDHGISGKKEECPYCQLKELILFSKKLKKSKRDWDVCVLSYPKSFFKREARPDQHVHGLYEIVNGFGLHELVIETPEHIANIADLSAEHLQCFLETSATRMKALSENSDIQHVLAYKNYGAVAGSEMMGHSRTHLIAMPIIPFHAKEKLSGAQAYFKKQRRCVYCDLIGQEIKAKTRIILENKHFVALTPFAARFLFEVWILPKKHSCDFMEGSQNVQKDLAMILKQLLEKIRDGLEDPAYNFVIQTAPIGMSAEKNVKDCYHWHIEILPRLTRVAGFEKGTGFYINSIPPEATAEFLRGVL